MSGHALVMVFHSLRWMKLFVLAINSMLFFIRRYHHEKTNPSITNKPTGCRPPHLFLLKMLFNTICLVCNMIRVPPCYPVVNFKSFRRQGICSHHDDVGQSVGLKSPSTYWITIDKKSIENIFEIYLNSKFWTQFNSIHHNFKHLRCNEGVKHVLFQKWCPKMRSF